MSLKTKGDALPPESFDSLRPRSLETEARAAQSRNVTSGDCFVGGEVSRERERRVGIGEAPLESYLAFGFYEKNVSNESVAAFGERRFRCSRGRVQNFCLLSAEVTLLILWARPCCM